MCILSQKSPDRPTPHDQPLYSTTGSVPKTQNITDQVMINGGLRTQLNQAAGQYATDKITSITSPRQSPAAAPFNPIPAVGGTTTTAKRSTDQDAQKIVK